MSETKKYYFLFISIPLLILSQENLPLFGITGGSGTSTLIGDLSKNKKDNTSFTAPPLFFIGTIIKFGEPFSFYASYFYSTIGGNIYSQNFFYNYKTTINSIEVEINYNFLHLYKNKIKESLNSYIYPFIGINIVSSDFLVKADLYDIFGAKYYWWSDGTIRDKPEGTYLPNQSKIIARDYTTDIDINENFYSKDGKYSERTFGGGVTTGVGIKISNTFSFEIGASLIHYLSDYLDGISSKTRFPISGDKKNDYVLKSFLRLIFKMPVFSSLLSKLKEGITADEFLAAGLRDDSDNDGVIDFLDECPNTPQGVPVDKKGCPFDTDGDGIPDYLDAEINSPKGAVVDSLGRTIPDDSLEKFLTSLDTGGALNTLYRGTATASQPRYFLKIGSLNSPIPENLAYILLSNPQIKPIQSGDTTIIAYGSYQDIPEMIKNKIKISESGITWATPMAEIPSENPEKILIQEYKLIGAKYARKKSFASTTSAPTEILPISLIPSSDEVVFRIQLGAFSKPIHNKIFAGIDNIVAYKFEDGLIRVYSKPFKTFKEAAQYKAELLKEGYRGLFVVAFKNGKKIPIHEAGIQLLPSQEQKSTPQETLSIDPSAIKYRVQYGAFTSDISPEMLNKLLQLSNVQKFVDNNVIKYVSPPYPTLEEAKMQKEKARNAGINDAFIVGEFRGKLIDLSLLKQLIKSQ